MKRMWIVCLMIVLGCCACKPRSVGSAKAEDKAVAVEGLPGCTAQEVTIKQVTDDPKDGALKKTVFVVRCPGQVVTTMERRTEGKTTHDYTAVADSPASTCPQGPLDRAGCKVLPETLSQGSSVLYTVACPR